MLRFLNGLRLFYFYSFNRRYLFQSVKKRRGSCKMCGDCCRECFYLVDNRCSVYHDRPRWCNKDFPIDAFDLKVRGLKNCGYYFEK